MWITDDNLVIRRPRSITINGVNHPPEIFTDWSKWELASIGIKPFVDNKFDGRYYDATSVTDIEVDGIVQRNYGTKQRYTLQELRDLRISEIKDSAHSLLEPTDWYIVRNAETGDPIPSEVSTRRVEIRTISNDAETTLNSETDYQAIIDYQVDWNSGNPA